MVVRRFELDVVWARWIVAIRRNDRISSGICHRIRVGRADGRAEALLESDK